MHSCMKSFVLPHTHVHVRVHEHHIYTYPCVVVSVFVYVHFSVAVAVAFTFTFCTYVCSKLFFLLDASISPGRGRGRGPCTLAIRARQSCLRRDDCTSDHSLIISLIRSKLHFSFSFVFFSHFSFPCSFSFSFSCHLSCAKTSTTIDLHQRSRVRIVHLWPLGLQACLFPDFQRCGPTWVLDCVGKH